MPERFLKSLTKYLSCNQLDTLQKATIGIAGLGGLGSNCALMLARSGLGHLVLLDCDLVEASNLNRQQYWPEDIGKPKTEALAKRLLALNPHLELKLICKTLEKSNLKELLSTSNLWIEALDKPETKALFVEEALKSKAWVVAASGIGGFGQKELKKRVLGNLTVIGDFCTDSLHYPMLAPKVTWAAAMMCDAVLEHLLAT
ncbi:MAG: sulfur carrier protein ThiS adenylyltransferase ThiF [Desulfovibrionaceae bacterium]|nr:sulfur carrier protein ThiS adenylyltransferase ThiF [Desulfovibrionaceae bacterium]